MMTKDEISAMQLSPEHMAWLDARRFRIVRSNRNPDVNEIVATGLVLEDARCQAEKLQAAYCREHPEKDGWTMDLFCVELESEPWKRKR